MNSKQTCPDCGAALPTNAPQGLCPRCLANIGLEAPAANELPRSDIQLERTGALIGRYKLLQKIGEGGFGVVYMAEQVEPVQRKVALKIIKAGMDTKEVIARFEAERQAISLMDHPNIARAIDAGTTEAGRPYFVMELVNGIPITDYCDQGQLPTCERLRLFIKVCQAVQHAHQKGVIHRDLKPSNVLVTLHDGEPVPKVIDFGVAKALGQRLTEKTLFTAFHHLIGTPAYMSPEQAALSGLDIDTRADIYSLGVLLYELLTGVTPFDAETFRQAGLDEIRRMIRETEPPKPSTRLQTLGQKLTEVAKHRQTEPATLSRLVRGDLDWIVMKCLEKDRKRRYETANGLAADLGRHLESEPIEARPPSNVYRIQKLLIRNKLAFAGASAVFAVLFVGIVVSTWQALRAGKAEHEKSILLEQTREALAMNQIQSAEQLFAADDYSTALVHLARVIAENLANEVIATRVFSKLSQQNFIIPLVENLKHSGPVRYAQFSPDGQKVVTASWDGTARVWSAVNGEPLTPPLQHQNKVNRAQFDFRGERVVTASEDHTSRIWDATSGQPLTHELRHGGPIGDVCFSPDGTLLLTSAAGAHVWDVNSGKLLFGGLPIQHPTRRLWQPFSPDGRLVTCDAGGAYVWDVKTGKRLLGPLSGHGTLSAEFSADGSRIVTGCSDKTARVWDAQTGDLISELRHDLHIWLARFSEDGQRVVTVCPDKTLQAWNANTGRALTRPIVGAWGKTAQFDPGGEWMLSAGLGHVSIWSTATGQVLTQSIEAPGLYWGELSRDGKRLVTASGVGYASIWGIRIGYTTESATFLPVPDWVPALLEALAGKRLNDQGVFEPLPSAQLSEIKNEVMASNAADAWTLWAKWLFTDSTNRAPIE